MNRPARRIRVVALVAALLTAGLLGLGALSPAAAVDDEDSGLRVSIDGLTPTRLSDDATVRMSGTVTNTGDQVWGDAQAYLVIPFTPFTTRQQVQAAIESDATYTGRRVVELDSIDELGDLQPGERVPFTIEVPYDDLTISGFEGVYPVGMQVLATDEDGTRSNSAVARATTFMPLLTGDTPSVPGTVVWPFLMPERMDAAGYTDAADLAASMGPDGQLRHLLDQAGATPLEATTVVLDPALLVAADDLANERGLGEATLSSEQREAVALFRDDLIALAQRASTWTTGFARPDLQAIGESMQADEFTAAVERTTTAALDRFQISGRHVAWPAAGGVTSELLEAVRGDGEEPVIVDRSNLPGWEPRQGSLIIHRTEDGPVPLLVDTGMDAGVPGGSTIATVRQRLLSEAALGSLERAGDSTSRADAVVVMDPTWDPGSPEQTADLGAVFGTDMLSASTLDELLTSDRIDGTWSLPDEPSGDALPAEQLESVEQIAGTVGTLTDLVVDSDAAGADLDRRIAELLALTWRDHREQGVQTAQAAARQSRQGLEALTIEGPPGVTLSSNQGSFPVTVSNEAPYSVRVGVRLETSNPALDIPDVEAVEVAAGERRTVNVAVDLAEQNSSVFTAQLITAGGTPIGNTDSFNVRSSAVGVALWVAIALAGAFVLFALVRRFWLPHRHEESDGE